LSTYQKHGAASSNEAGVTRSDGLDELVLRKQMERRREEEGRKRPDYHRVHREESL